MIKRFLKFCLLLSLLIFLWCAGLVIAIATGGQAHENAQADVAIVLGAAVYTNRPSPVFIERIQHGVHLYQQKKVKAIIFTGGLAEGDQLAESEAAKRYALAQGVPEQAIWIEKKSTTTAENLQYAKNIMDQQGFNTAIIVSDPHHLRRASMYASKKGINAITDPTPTSRYKGFKAISEQFAKEGYLITRLIVMGY